MTTFTNDLFSGEYGYFLAQYRGNGKFGIDNGQEIFDFICSFQCGQSSNGIIFGLCTIRDKNFSGFFLELDEANTQFHLRGETENGYQIQTFGKVSIRSVTARQSNELQSQTQILFACEKLILQRPFETSPIEQRYYLTNLELDKPIHLENGNFSISILKSKNYTRKIESVISMRTTQITTILTITTKDIPISTKTTGALALDISYLLSLARGCSIQYPFSETYTTSPKPSYIEHSSLKINPYSPQGIILPMDLQNFLEQTILHYSEVAKEWELPRLIRQFVDSVNEQDHLEFRALKLVVLLEYIVSKYVQRRNIDFILSQEFFEKHKATLKKQLKYILKELYPGSNCSQRDKMTMHLAALNRPSFSVSCGQLLKELKLDSTDLSAVKLIRDKLVHEARFLNFKIDTEEWNKIEQRNYWQQYSLLVSFISRILLAILKYEGYYYDWKFHKLADWYGSRMEGRKKLEG